MNDIKIKNENAFMEALRNRALITPLLIPTLRHHEVAGILCHIQPCLNLHKGELLVNLCVSTLNNWGLMRHIYVGNLTIIGSDYSLSPGRHQAIIWTDAGILLHQEQISMKS